MRVRVSVLVRGAPAASLPEILKAPRRTILGTSLTVVAPTGEYFPNRLIDLGTNRWGFKPEFRAVAAGRTAVAARHGCRPLVVLSQGGDGLGLTVRASDKGRSVDVGTL